MPIYKRCNICGKRIAPTEKCSCIKQRHNTEYDRYSRDERSTAFYHSQEWERMRTHVLNMDEGIDVYLYCTTGEVAPADTVHHIIPLKEDWSRRLDPANLISLSAKSHGMIEEWYKRDKAGTIRKLKEMVGMFRNTQGGI